MRSLATVLRRQGKAEEAEPLYREALDGCSRALGPDHSDTLSALQSMGRVMTDLKRFAEAEEYFHRALEGRRRVQGNDHPPHDRGDSGFIGGAPAKREI